MNQKPQIHQNDRVTWIVISTIFLAIGFYLTFVLGNIAQGIIWFGAAIAFFTFSNNPSK
jgi:hypothetical protein